MIYLRKVVSVNSDVLEFTLGDLDIFSWGGQSGSEAESEDNEEFHFELVEDCWLFT